MLVREIEKQRGTVQQRKEFNYRVTFEGERTLPGC